MRKAPKKQFTPEELAQMAAMEAAWDAAIEADTSDLCFEEADDECEKWESGYADDPESL